jgi:hypothetical protein
VPRCLVHVLGSRLLTMQKRPMAVYTSSTGCKTLTKGSPRHPRSSARLEYRYSATAPVNVSLYFLFLRKDYLKPEMRGPISRLQRYPAAQTFPLRLLQECSGVSFMTRTTLVLTPWRTMRHGPFRRTPEQTRNSSTDMCIGEDLSLEHADIVNQHENMIKELVERKDAIRKPRFCHLPYKYRVRWKAHRDAPPVHL